jgi:hypothetical protein
MSTLSKTIAAILAFLGVVLVWTLLVTIPVQLLWNWLMPIIFGLPKISFWQTVGLILLINFLFNHNRSGKSNEK